MYITSKFFTQRSKFDIRFKSVFRQSYFLLHYLPDGCFATKQSEAEHKLMRLVGK